MRQVLAIACILSWWASALVLGQLDSLAAADAPRVFTYDGEPFVPQVLSPTDTPDCPRIGDVIEVGEMRLILREDGPCHFVSKPFPHEQLLLRSSDGVERTVGIAVGTKDGADTSIRSSDAGEPLTPDAIRELWGIRLNDWSEMSMAALAHLDLERTFVAVSVRPTATGSPPLPKLPKGLRYLGVELGFGEGVRDLSFVSDQTSLRGLWMASISPKDATIDWRLLRGLSELRSLDVRSVTFQQTERPTPLPELRTLNLRDCRGIGRLEFAGEMPELRSADLSRSDAADIGPLAKLQSLAELNITLTQVTRLPVGNWPALKRFTLFSTSVSYRASRYFAQEHPQCQVRHGWASALEQAVAETNRLRIRSGGTCHCIPVEEKTLAEVTDQELIRQLIDGIEVDESQRDLCCACCGNPSLEFYRGDQLLATVSCHHGVSLRWDDWPSDAILTDASAQRVVVWLARRGVSGPAEELRENRPNALGGQGLLITTVFRNTAATRLTDGAGNRVRIETGDRLLAIDGEKVLSARHFEQIVSRKARRKACTVTIIDKDTGGELELHARLDQGGGKRLGMQVKDPADE